MAAFEFIREHGVWADISTLTADEMQRFDRNQQKALNAEDGGAWAPTSPIEIGGQGIILTGPAQFQDLTVNGKLFVPNGGEINGALIARNLLRVDGLAAFESTVEVAGAATFDSTLAVLGVADFNGNEFGASLRTAQGIIVGAASRFDGAVNVFGNFSAAGVVDFANFVLLGQSEVGGLVTLRAPMKASGYGRYAGKSFVASEDKDGVVYTPALYQQVVIPPNLFSGLRVMVLSDSNCQDDDEITFTNNGFTYSAYIQAPGGAMVWTLIAQHFVTLKRVEGAWTRVRGGSFVQHLTPD